MSLKATRLVEITSEVIADEKLKEIQRQNYGKFQHYVTFREMRKLRIGGSWARRIPRRVWHLKSQESEVF